MTYVCIIYNTAILEHIPMRIHRPQVPGIPKLLLRRSPKMGAPPERSNRLGP